MSSTLFTLRLSEIDQRVFANITRKHVTLYEQTAKADSVLSYVIESIKFSVEQLRTHVQQNERFKKRTRIAKSQVDLNEILLEYSQVLGANKKQLRGDKKALDRYLDAEALNDRFARNLGEDERELIYLLGRLAVVMTESTSEVSIKVWQASDATKLLEALLIYKGDARVRIATKDCISLVFRKNNGTGSPTIAPTISLIQLLLRVAQNPKLEIELQIASFSALAQVSPAEFSTLALSTIEKSRLNEQGGGKDDFFVRAEIARILCRDYLQLPSVENLISEIKHDRSDFVRQELVRGSLTLPHDIALDLLLEMLQHETVDKVSASAIFALCQFHYLDTPTLFRVGDHLGALIRSSDSELVTRAVLDALPRLAARLASDSNLCSDTSDLQKWYRRFNPIISETHLNTDHLKIRRWASSSREALWVQCHITERKHYLKLKQHLESVRPSKTAHINSIGELSEEALGRVLSVIAQEDFGFDVQCKRKGIKLTRWVRFKFRLWRFLYELKNSASDKRQAHKHMIGRVFYGLMSVPSGRLAEQTITKVPGEPVTVTAEDGPRNYLPLVDELISSLDQSWPTQPLKIYTSEGITLITPPSGFIARLRARWTLTWQFALYAELRNWKEGSTNDANEYLSRVADLGFTFSMTGYTQEIGQEPYPIHASISRFLPAYTLPSLALFWSEIKDYFASVYANSLSQLWAFMLGLFALFVGKHAVANHQMNKSRSAIPLSVGGWGTRGKSGTERLKAAVFNGLGLKVISKTTGCEAMFLEGGAHQPLRELFLFRPYDKATIWEQVNLMKIAAQLKADVFLWECMGLTPAYVHILQRHWMRDDIATITNTYPDHEDVQGPAGIDIPLVMNEFIPKNSTLVTSEEIMLPILRAGCQELGTACHEVTWRETMTVTDDIMSRFPYEEHQNNIALVTVMCEQLEVPRHVTLKSMADNVVLDLGVLKTYPRSTINGRTLEYVMGNSANERLGAMGNWRRMGFEQNTLELSPETWVSTIVNNRADRIPRSKVFASMLVKDISADSHVIIGTNVEGFETFLHEAWNEQYAGYSIWQSDLEEARKRCIDMATRFRVATDASHIVARISAMSVGLGGEQVVEIESLTAITDLSLPQEQQTHTEHIKQLAEQWFNEHKAFIDVIENLASRDQEESNSLILALAKQAFFDRIHCYVDSSISGEEIISEIVTKTPPGLTNRIMGLQNIKGTGLDFVYRWQAWERCHQACKQLESEDEASRLNGLKELRSFEEYGQLSRDYVREKTELHRNSPQFQMESAQADLLEIETKVSPNNNQVVQKESGRFNQPYIRKAINVVEQLLDLGDAVDRRKKADRIYQDLINYRISRARATVELQALTKRQKGNWLIKQLSG